MCCCCSAVPSSTDTAIAPFTMPGASRPRQRAFNRMHSVKLSRNIWVLCGLCRDVLLAPHHHQASTCWPSGGIALASLRFSEPIAPASALRPHSLCTPPDAQLLRRGLSARARRVCGHFGVESARAAEKSASLRCQLWKLQTAKRMSIETASFPLRSPLRLAA